MRLSSSSLSGATSFVPPFGRSFCIDFDCLTWRRGWGRGMRSRQNPTQFHQSSHRNSGRLVRTGSRHANFVAISEPDFLVDHIVLYLFPPPPCVFRTALSRSSRPLSLALEVVTSPLALISHCAFDLSIRCSFSILISFNELCSFLLSLPLSWSLHNDPQKNGLERSTAEPETRTNQLISAI